MEITWWKRYESQSQEWNQRIQKGMVIQLSLCNTRKKPKQNKAWRSLQESTGIQKGTQMF